MNNIILIGFAATGKSTVGALLARKMCKQFADTDSLIECEMSMSVSQIFEKFGQQYFRDKESAVLLRLKQTDNSVISCGGGSVLSPFFTDFAATGTVVWLRASVDAVQNRMNGGRPLFDGLSRDQLQNHIRSREHLYKIFSDIVIDTDDKTPEQVAEQIYLLLQKFTTENLLK